MVARIKIGDDFWEAQKSRQQPIVWDEQSLSNPHVGVTGTTGAGKTHWIKQFCAGMPSDVEIDIYDYHGDIEIPGARSVLFSESTRYGYNPLVLNPDEHYGGVRRCVADMLDAMNTSTRKLGENQAGVLRNLLVDTFALRGIYASSPATWRRREMTEAEARQCVERRDWGAMREAYPHLSDVVSLARRKLKALWLGVEDSGQGRAVMSAFDDCSRAMSSLNAMRTKLAKARGGSAEEAETLQKRMDVSKGKAIEAFTSYIEKLETGREFEEAIKYNSKDVLLSVITRLENLMDKGIFNPNPPPFGNAAIRRFNLKPVAQSVDELRMFVNMRLQATIREMMQLGESKRVRRLVVLDECKTYLDEDPRAPINVIATEMRKFGLMLVLAGQSPAHWSRDFIKSAGTLLILNLATVDWDEAARKLRIDLADLKYLRPQQTGAVRMLEKGKPPAFRRVQFLNAAARA